MEELIEKAKKGDEDAYVELIHLVEKDLFNIATIKLSNLEDVNDAFQETMLKSFKNIKKLKEPKQFKAWIVKILINECNRMYVKKYKRKNLLEKIQENYNNKSFENEDIYNIENKMDFNLIISKLRYDEQIIVTLYFDNNFTIGEISKILNININTVKTRLRRAEEKIEKIMRKGDK